MTNFKSSEVMSEFEKIALENGIIKDEHGNRLLDESDPWGKSMEKAEEEVFEKHITKPVMAIQKAIVETTGMPVSRSGKPDGIWGPLTAAGWNKMIEKLESDSLYELDLQPAIKHMPTKEDIATVLNFLNKKEKNDKFDMGLEFQDEKTRIEKQKKEVAKGIENEPGRKSDFSILEPKKQFEADDDMEMGLDFQTKKERLKKQKEEIEKNRELPKPSNQFADDVIQELETLANDLSIMNIKAAIGVSNEIKQFKIALDIYNTSNETGEDLINAAHPEGSPVLFDVADDGGKVETIVEEQKKNIEKTKKQPTGKVAEAVVRMVAIANRLEDEGKIEEAKMVDAAIKEITSPFLSEELVLKAAGSDEIKALGETHFQEQLTYENWRELIPYKLGKLISKADILKTKIDLSSAIFQDRQGVVVEDILDKLKQIIRGWRQDVQLEKINHIDLAEKIKKTFKPIEYGAFDYEYIFGSSDIEDFREFLKYAYSVSNELSGIKKPEEDIVTKPRVERYHAILDEFKRDIERDLSDPFDSKLVKLYGNEEQKIRKIIDLINRSKEETSDGSVSLKEINRRLEEIIEFRKNLEKMLKEAFFVCKIKKQAFGFSKDLLPSGPKTVLLPEQTVSVKEEDKPSNWQSRNPRLNKQISKPKKRFKGSNKRKKIRELQEAILIAGIKIEGSNPIDGIWGPNTAKATKELFEKVGKKTLANKINDQDIENEILNKALMAARVVKNIKKDSGFVIKLDEDFSIKLSELDSFDSFKEAVGKVESLKIIKEFVKGFLNKLKTNMGFAYKLVEDSGDEDIVTKIKQKLKNLLKEAKEYFKKKEEEKRLSSEVKQPSDGQKPSVSQKPSVGQPQTTTKTDGKENFTPDKGTVGQIETKRLDFFDMTPINTLDDFKKAYRNLISLDDLNTASIKALALAKGELPSQTFRKVRNSFVRFYSAAKEMMPQIEAKWDRQSVVKLKEYLRNYLSKFQVVQDDLKIT